MDDGRRYAELSLLTDLLPVIDNVGPSPPPIRRVSWPASRWWLNGSSSARHSCTKIDALNHAFDPHKHRHPAAA